MTNRQSAVPRMLAVCLAGALVAAPALLAQTTFKLAKNKYTPAQDVALGLKAAAEVRKEYPVIDEGVVTAYLSRLGDGLVAAAPASLKEPVYKFSFTGVNLKEINAFALPGGPMFVNRGMIDAAKGEGEIVGVMAHELSHVLLRHGTANATKAQNPWLQLGQVAGVVGGSMVGGAVGAMISDGTQFGLSTMLLRYSRDFEKQADLLGVAIMANAGYDPRDLARMFETIAKSGSGAPPEWLSSHPDPGNRSAYIVKEAQTVTMRPRADTNEFALAKIAVAGLPAPITMAELARRRDPNTGTAAANAATGTPGLPVPPPSAQFKEITTGVFTASVPSNWTSLQSSSAIRVVPENGYGQLKGQTVFTHGVEFGVAKAASRDLSEATMAWLKAAAQGNSEIRLDGQPQNVRMSGRAALGTQLVNPSPLGGIERIALYTTFLANGNLFYYLTISPDADVTTYQTTFVRIGQSIKLTDIR